MACSTIPDLDVMGFRFGIHHGDFWGHRGFTHSLAFAAVLALAFTVGISLIRFVIHKQGTEKLSQKMGFGKGTASDGRLRPARDASFSS
jgi:hypothetical protein